MRSDVEANRAMERYADIMWRICMVHLKNYADTEDIFQTVNISSLAVFESVEHEKAWFIRVKINACKDVLKSFFWNNTVSIDVADATGEHSKVLECVLSLPEKYRDVVYLHDYDMDMSINVQSPNTQNYCAYF